MKFFAEAGLKLVIEQTRRANKIAREVAPSEVVDLSFRRAAQAALGIKARRPRSAKSQNAKETQADFL